jgi:hypothetical protein
MLIIELRKWKNILRIYSVVRKGGMRTKRLEVMP